MYVSLSVVLQSTDWLLLKNWSVKAINFQRLYSISTWETFFKLLTAYVIINSITNLVIKTCRCLCVTYSDSNRRAVNYVTGRLGTLTLKLTDPGPTLKLEDHRLSAVRDWLFNPFAATLHIRGRAMPWWQWTHATWVPFRLKRNPKTIRYYTTKWRQKQLHLHAPDSPNLSRDTRVSHLGC
jgi:hypothetical protein